MTGPVAVEAVDSGVQGPPRRQEAASAAGELPPSLSGPLAATLERLRALDPWSQAQVGWPDGDDWFDLDRVVEDGHLDGWLDDLVRDKGGQCDVAGAYLGSWLAGALIDVPLAAVLTERRLPDLGGLWVHRHEEGWFDQVSFSSPAVAVTVDDPDAGHPHATVVGDREALWDRCATDLVEALSPLLAAVRARSPYGLRGLWGAVADDVAGRALGLARRTDRDGQAAWQQSQSLLDRMAQHQGLLRLRSTPFPVTWSGGEALFQVKGTCCLFYKTHEGPADSRGEGYCTTCPFREDASRTERLRHHLEHPEAD